MPSIPGMIGGGVGVGAGNYLFDTLFPDPSKKAMGPLNDIPGTIKPYFDPYVNAGKNALPGYQQMMQMLMTNPTAFLNKLGSGYQQSPGYDWNMKQGQSAISNANAAGGLVGSPQHEQQAGEMATGLASKDYSDYMSRIMQMLGLGSAGTESLIKTGAGASSDLATNLAQALSQQSALKYAGQASQNNAKGGIISDIAGMFKSGFGF